MRNGFIWFTELLICINSAQSKKPFGKREREIWRLECALGVITDSDCPVDGGWSPWTTWSSCQGPCDNIGHRKRIRECSNPLTSKDGTPCAGPDEQIEACYITNCTVEDFQRLIVGDAPRTEALHQLKTVPALLERCLQMECPYEEVETALTSDNTWQVNSEALWNSLQCVKHNIGCPIRGEWGVWGSWSACGARCGNGLRWRLRRCDTPPPSEASRTCSGTPLQSEKCEGDHCAIEGRYAEYVAGGTWTEWGQWSMCSEICGNGVRRRKRTCHENHIPFTSFTWGTHCRGQHDQLEVCINIRCSLDGGWSGWSPWGPCSQTCGAGRRSRARSCTKPIPSGDGKNCDGPRFETGTCYLEPCKVYTHLVALFNGDSYFHYNLFGKRSRLFHFYIRFKPLSPSGTLVRRGSLQSPYIRLSLQKWHICLDASGLSQACDLSRICSSRALEPAVWHTALITVSTETAIMRLDNALTHVKGFFPCDPELENSAINIYVGERFNGEIQELILNFNVLGLIVERHNWISRTDLFPRFSSNVAFEKANIEEAFLNLENDHYIRLPCFEVQDEWRLELIVKPKRDNGIILFLSDNTTNSWMYMALQNMRVKIKVAVDEFRSEISSSTDYPPNQWLDIMLSRSLGTNTIESIINQGEKLHVLLTDNSILKQRRKKRNPHIKGRNRKIRSESLSLCNDEFFVGDIPANLKYQISEEFTSFSGVIASLVVNGILLDLYNCNLERCKDDKIQLSSRTASISRSYQETGWGFSNTLKLTCLHARIAENHKYAQWFFLDTTLNEQPNENKTLKFVDDSRMLRLIITKDNDRKGFYTCRAHSNKYTYNVVTYGILGPVNNSLNIPDLTTIISVITTVMLIVCTLSWLVMEGINDLRKGYGFFRDAHFSPQDEAEAVCNYIDQNIHLYTSKDAVRLAKAKAHRKGRQLASKLSFGAQEPQGLLQMQNVVPEASNESDSSEIESLPALPDIKISRSGPSHDIYKCAVPYSSSPRLGSILPPPKLSSSLEMSPRILCSRLLLTKYKHESKENIRSRKYKPTRSSDDSSENKWKVFSNKQESKENIRSRKYKLTHSSDVSDENKSELFPRKSLALVNLSPVQKVLQKFHELKNQDS